MPGKHYKCCYITCTTEAARDGLADGQTYKSRYVHKHTVRPGYVYIIYVYIHDASARTQSERARERDTHTQTYTQKFMDMNNKP